jgi:putative phosphoribosyl transferase
MIYPDRTSAGKFLGHKLREYTNRDDVLVLAIPRGGVPVAFEVADSLDAPLDIFVVRKLGVPGREELAMGAIATGGIRLLNKTVVDHFKISSTLIDAITKREMLELERRQRTYRGDRPEPEVAGKVVILVDDGLATGSTMRAAVQALRHEAPAKIIVAVPVSAVEACDKKKMGADEIVWGATPEPFYEVGRWYDDFSQTTDQEVAELINEAHALKQHDLVEA